MTAVKSFYSNENVADLETKINEWLSKNKVIKVIAINYQATPDTINNGANHYALITYGGI